MFVGGASAVGVIVPNRRSAIDCVTAAGATGPAVLISTTMIAS